jgi:iron complex transport system ATP-binding protein
MTEFRMTEFLMTKHVDEAGSVATSGALAAPGSVPTSVHTPELLAEDLSCGYPRAGRVVLSGVNLRMQRGRFFCVIGPNGAGKTTLLRSLAGLLPPLAGRVRVRGAEIAGLNARERARRLSVVLSHLESPGYLTVARFVELGRHPYTGLLAGLDDADREAVERALERTGLTGLRDRWMTEISDGERRRAAVARALAQAADIMILDEPTAFLDVAARAKVMTTLRDIARETERLIVTTSHDVELVLRTADVVAVIDGDGALTVGSPEDLVLSGAIASLFPDTTLRFDYRTGSFRPPHPTGPAVFVDGSGLAAEWTAHALERIGRRVVDTKQDDAPTVQVRTGPTVTWTVVTASERQRADSIAAVAELLR